MKSYYPEGEYTIVKEFTQKRFLIELRGGSIEIDNDDTSYSTAQAKHLARGITQLPKLRKLLVKMTIQAGLAEDESEAERRSDYTLLFELNKVFTDLVSLVMPCYESLDE